MPRRGLPELLAASAAKHPDRIAVEDVDGREVSYRELSERSDGVAGGLMNLGVQSGDRVGVYLPKSAASVAALFGILKIGAAYVPVDPSAPPRRAACILRDCGVTLTILDPRLQAPLCRAWEDGSVPNLVPVEDTADWSRSTSRVLKPFPPLDQLAYILYTSGSTGQPKGVMHSHEAALAFLHWCSDTFHPSCGDRFSSHAPFHFDLSILDLFLSVKHGGTLVLIGEDAGKNPAQLASLISERRLSIWYSVPSILTLLVQYGRLERYDYSGLRLILFAGEVFPVVQLRRLKDILPKPTYVNLYGPTETNLCTYYEVPEHIPPEQVEPMPIGTACANFRTKVVAESGRVVGLGEEGELCVAGSGVMLGYWNRSDETRRSFEVDDVGHRWYRTGDVVVQRNDGNYVFRGRRDRMVKRRGYRVELGEIETCLYQHPDVEEAAAIACEVAEGEVRIATFLKTRSGRRLSLIKLKQFCGRHLPTYMIPDTFLFLDGLPRTSTDKVDYQQLKDVL